MPTKNERRWAEISRRKHGIRSPMESALIGGGCLLAGIAGGCVIAVGILAGIVLWRMVF